jgi:hypothetical protein
MLFFSFQEAASTVLERRSFRDSVEFAACARLAEVPEPKGEAESVG